MRKARFFALASVLSLVLAGPAWAQVKQGDLDLTFHSQVEVDFEFRDNYSFNDNVNAINARDQFFVEQETRFWIDAKAGPFESRVMFEEEDFWDGVGVGEADADDTGNIEQAYGGYDFGWFKGRVGLQVFQLDPGEIVYIDDDFGVRLWNTYDWGGWNFFWVFNQEGSDAAATTPNRDRHYFMGNLDLKLAGWTVTPFVAYAIAKDEPTTFSGRAIEDVEAWWLGAGAKGNVVGINVLAQFAYVTGDIDHRPGVVPNNVDVSAWAGMLSLAYPIPATPLTIEVAGVWMSGDDSSADTDAEGFQGIFQDTELLNPQGIWIDDDIIIAPKVAGSPQSCRGAACAGTFFLTTDDDFSPGGSAAGTSDFDFDARSAAFVAAGPGNPGNFGLQYYHAALHYKVTSNLTVSAMFAYILAMEDKLLGGDSHLGNEYTIHAVWTPHKYFRVTPTLSWLVPGDAIDNIVGTDDTAFNFVLETMFLF